MKRSIREKLARRLFPQVFARVDQLLQELSVFQGDCAGMVLRGRDISGDPFTIDLRGAQQAALELGSSFVPDDARPQKSFRLGVREGQRVRLDNPDGVTFFDARVEAT